MTLIHDPIADLVIRIKNAGAVNKEFVEVPYSKLKHQIAEALLRAGFVKNVVKEGKDVKKTLKIEIAYIYIEE